MNLASLFAFGVGTQQILCDCDSRMSKHLLGRNAGGSGHKSDDPCETRSNSYQNVAVNSEDIDVFLILLSLHSQIPTRILLRRGKGNAVELIDIPRLGTILGEDVSSCLPGHDRCSRLYWM